jgi:hypothetical protein
MFAVSVLVLCASILLGGATRHGFLSDAVLQLVSLPALVAVGYKWQALYRPVSGHGMAFAICCAIVFIPMLQLFPLPAALVAFVEPNTAVSDVLSLAGIATSVRTLSVAPYTTALSALSLVPLVTLFLAIQLLSTQQRRRLNLVLLALALASVMLGLLQLASGPSSQLRPFAYTNIRGAHLLRHHLRDRVAPEGGHKTGEIKGQFEWTRRL